MPERTADKESKAMEVLLHEWMEKLWPTKAGFFFHLVLTLAYFCVYSDVLGILNGVVLIHNLSIMLHHGLIWAQCFE